MDRTKKIKYSFLISFFLAFIIFNLSELTVKASTVVLPSEYYFVFNGQKKSSGSEYEMTMPEVLLNVTAGTWEPSTTVEWVSSEPRVVSLEPYDTSSESKSNFVKMIRKGPGYSTITAIVKHGTNSYSLSCVVKVGLSFDYQKTGMITTTTTKERVLIIDSIDPTSTASKKQVYLKYVDYTPEGGVTPVTGSAISADMVTWESNNEGVAKVSDTGLVTAVGAGTATITVTSNTMSSQDKPMKISMTVLVKPTFSLTFTNSANVTETYYSTSSKKDSSSVVKGVPSNFVINSNGTLGTNLKWVVYDAITEKKISEGTSDRMTYIVSNVSGNVSFSNVKAGTYEIYAFADDKYNQDTNAPYAYMKIVVPIALNDLNLTMTVGDTYNLIENSNIVGVGTFGIPKYLSGSQNIAYFNTKDYVITAKSKGTVSIELNYNTSMKLFTDPVDPIVINVTVIDGIALSTTSATLYTKGTLKLDAVVTDPTVPIVWSSSDPKVATVEDGLVTALKPGITTITAKQTINGVVKTAYCQITVQQSVSSIVLEPAEANLAIKEYLTIHAKVTPNDLKNVVLTWKSSNEKVVKISETNPLTVTVQGIAGGTAVVSAINQDNVVVGYTHITVRQPVTSIVLSETSATVSLSSKTLQIRATVYPETAQNKSVTWKSTDTSKATVDSNGKVTFLKPGTVTIIATSVDNPSVTAMCNLNIDVPVSSISLDTTSKTMYVGETIRLTYALTPSDATNNAVTWTSTNPSVATVDGSGKVTAKSVGSTVIILKAVDGGDSVYCTITVKSVAKGVKFDVSKLDLKQGEYYTLKTTFTPNDSTDTKLEWESSDTKVATVDKNGKVVAKSAGTAIIMAKTEAGGVAYCKVTVTVPVTGLVLNFTEKTIYIGQKFDLEVSISPSSATNKEVTWKSSNEKIVTVNNKGEIKGIKGGTAIITVITADGGVKETCVVTVREPVTTITLNHENYILGVNRSFMLKATVTSESATNPTVIWESSNPKIATVTQKGKVTGHKTGTVTITAIAADGSEVEASCEVRVVNPVTSITINKSYMNLMVGNRGTLKVTVEPSNATYKTLKWSSSDPSVAIVDDKGVVTALKEGKTTITAEAQDNSGQKVVCYVVVYDRVPSTGVTLQDKKITMISGETKVVQLVLIPATSTDTYTWSTDNPAVAKVDKKTGKITAKSTGTAYVTVMTESGKTATVEVNVIGLNMTSITLEQYTTYPYKLEVEGATSSVKWVVEDPKIAVINNGIVSTRGVGTTTITAIVNGRKLKCKLTVVKIK